VECKQRRSSSTRCVQRRRNVQSSSIILQSHQQLRIIVQPPKTQVGAIMSNITMPGAVEVTLAESTIVQCDAMLETLTHEGSTILLTDYLQPLFMSGLEMFLPKCIYVRKEMCDVFAELTKASRRQKQILIGSPGVGKSILLFLVALYRAETEKKPCLFIRKTRNSQELLSVFVITKHQSAAAGALTVFHDRDVDKTLRAQDILKETLRLLFNKTPREAARSILNDDFLVFLDGIHQGSDDLIMPHHYLSTSGGFDTPQGESAMYSTLVVLGGWQKKALFEGLKVVAPESGINLAGANEDDADRLEDIYYHTGGRMREALLYSKDPVMWKAEKKAMIEKIPKGQAVLSIIETNSSADKDSADRIRTMFRMEESGNYFGSALQIVDSQYYARLLHDKVGLEQYLNAYKHATDRSLSTAAGCHFEELLHVLFQKLPRPIESVLKSEGKGAEGVEQLQGYSVYWIPSISNFANIDAAVVIRDGQDKATMWCLQYTVSSSHSFNSRTFRTKFLNRLKFTSKFTGFQQVKILFVVPKGTDFTLPAEVVEDPEIEGVQTSVDCKDVDALKRSVENFDFVLKPHSFFDDVPRSSTS
jgi:hypothetical protein